MLKRLLRGIIIKGKWWRNLLLATLLISIGNSKQIHGALLLEQAWPCACELDGKVNIGGSEYEIREVLLATRIGTLEELKKIVKISHYFISDKSQFSYQCPMVSLSQCSNGRLVMATLESGIDEDNFRMARDGNIWNKIELALSSQYTVSQLKNIKRIYNFGRRRNEEFGKGDVAFYDIAETMMLNIVEEDLAAIPKLDTTEKGYINTFNHVTAQAFMTTMFSERLADFVADIHERYNMPELLTGEFTQEQLIDPIDNPVDNYVDLINNEWGQELGKKLKVKYNINPSTEWTPELLTAYLNDMQEYYSWAFQLRFNPFTPEDSLVIKFSNKVNKVMVNPPEYNLGKVENIKQRHKLGYGN